MQVDLKVVPGASRTEWVGLHGDRYRLRVAAPPEGGKANKAIVAYVAQRLGVTRRDISVVRGTSSPLKTLEVRGISPTQATDRLT